MCERIYAQFVRIILIPYILTGAGICLCTGSIAQRGRLRCNCGESVVAKLGTAGPSSVCELIVKSIVWCCRTSRPWVETW